MNNCPSHVDTVYYLSKYNLDFHNKKEAIEHYLKIGKQKGYFPNREMEVFFCKTMNFDDAYYRRKYCISGDHKAVKRHWKLYGSREGHFVNHCEEMGEHMPFTCKCRIKNKTADKRYSEDCNQFTENVESDQYSLSDHDHYVFSEKADTKPKTKKKSKKEISDDSMDSKLSSSCPSRPDVDDSIEYVSDKKQTKDKKQHETRDKKQHEIGNKKQHEKQKSESDSDDLQEEVENALDSESLVASIASDASNDSETQGKKSSDSKDSKTALDSVEQSERTDNSSKTRSKSKHSETDSASTATTTTTSSSSSSESTPSHGSEHSSKHSSEHSSEHSSKSSECDCSECLAGKTKTQEIEKPKETQNAIYDSKSLTSRYKSKLNRYTANTKQEKVEKKISTIPKESVEQTKTNNKEIQLNIVDNDSFEEDFIDDGYRVVDHMKQKSVPPKNQEKGHECEKEKIFDEDSVDDMDESTFTKVYTDLKEKLVKPINVKFSDIRDNNSAPSLEHSLAIDEIKLQKVQDKLMKKSDTCGVDLIDRYIFDKHMEIVCQNISSIKNYLNMCHIHLDTYTTILKQAYQCLVDICNSQNNYMTYNAARVSLCNMLKEAENTVRTSYCNDLPIFYIRTSFKKSPTSIRFPLLVCTNDTVNKFLIQNVGKEHVYFKIQLMKMNLKHLKLERYCLPPLNRDEKVTSNTSPIPPSNCPIGKTPSRDMYLEPDLVKCWDMNYHLKQFENAMYKITMTKETLCNYSKLIDIKEELVLKIKIANAKSE